MEQQINKGCPDQWDFTDGLGIGANTLSNVSEKNVSIFAFHPSEDVNQSINQSIFICTTEVGLK